MIHTTRIVPDKGPALPPRFRAQCNCGWCGPVHGHTGAARFDALDHVLSDGE